MNWPAKVSVCEVGPRDGLQNEKKLLSIEQKVDLIEKSVQAGAKIVEIGSFVHPKAVPQMADTDEVARRIRREPGVEYRALVMNQKGLERAAAAGIMKAKITASASPAHSLSNLNRTPEEVVSSFAEYAEFAAANQIELSGAISTAFGCPFDGKPVPLQQVLSVAACFRKIGIKELSLSDTTGMANPKQVYDYVMNNPETQEFIKRLLAFTDYAFEQYVKEGKNHFTVAIGCTGGQHRSVTITNFLYDHYKEKYNCYKEHRDEKEWIKNEQQ